MWYDFGDQIHDRTWTDKVLKNLRILFQKFQNLENVSRTSWLFSTSHICTSPLCHRLLENILTLHIWLLVSKKQLPLHIVISEPIFLPAKVQIITDIYITITIQLYIKKEKKSLLLWLFLKKMDTNGHLEKGWRIMSFLFLDGHQSRLVLEFLKKLNKRKQNGMCP